MLRSFTFILLTFSFIFACEAAEGPGAGRFGLGVEVGYPTAMTGKYWLNSVHTVDFGLGFGPANWTMLYGDFFWNMPQLFGTSSKFAQQLTAYVGIGGGLSSWNNTYYCNRWVCDNAHDHGTALFVRVPFGAEWYPGNPPIGVFVEIAPFVTLTPVSGTSIDLGTGIRFYF